MRSAAGTLVLPQDVVALLNVPCQGRSRVWIGADIAPVGRWPGLGRGHLVPLRDLVLRPRTAGRAEMECEPRSATVIAAADQEPVRPFLKLCFEHSNLKVVLHPFVLPVNPYQALVDPEPRVVRSIDGQPHFLGRRRVNGRFGVPDRVAMARARGPVPSVLAPRGRTDFPCGGFDIDRSQEPVLPQPLER